MAHPDTSHISFTYPSAASMWVVTLDYLLCNRTNPYSVTLLTTGSGYFWAKPSPVWVTQLFYNLVILHIPAYKDGTECSETSAYKIQTPGNYPEEIIQHYILFIGNYYHYPSRYNARLQTDLVKSVRDFSFPSPRRWDLRSCGILRSEEW